MSKEEKPLLGSIQASDPQLNALFKEALDGIRDDITEAQENVQTYHDAMQDETGGKDVYGNAYNEALKIKGSARARQLSFLGMFKDRVAVKEKVQMLNDAKKESGGVSSFDHSQLNKFIEDYQNPKDKFTKPTLSIEDDDDDDLNDDDD